MWRRKAGRAGRGVSSKKQISGPFSSSLAACAPELQRRSGRPGGAKSEEALRHFEIHSVIQAYSNYLGVRV